MGQQHTEYVLSEYGPNFALRFHLTSRCFPPAPYMIDSARAAIDAYNAGQDTTEITLPAGMTYHGKQTAPAFSIVATWRLEAFLTPDDYDA